MKNVLIFIILSMVTGCSSELKNIFVIHSNQNDSEVTLELLKYDESQNLYRGRVIIRNLSNTKSIKFNGLSIKHGDQNYSVYIDSIATILYIKIDPKKTEKIDIITSKIPKGIDPQELEIVLSPNK